MRLLIRRASVPMLIFFVGNVVFTVIAQVPAQPQRLGTEFGSQRLSANAPNATATPRWTGPRALLPSGKCHPNGSTPRSQPES